jgi:hypothetical protein
VRALLDVDCPQRHQREGKMNPTLRSSTGCHFSTYFSYEYLSCFLVQLADMTSACRSAAHGADGLSRVQHPIEFHHDPPKRLPSRPVSEPPISFSSLVTLARRLTVLYCPCVRRVKLGHQPVFLVLFVHSVCLTAQLGLSPPGPED